MLERHHPPAIAHQRFDVAASEEALRSALHEIETGFDFRISARAKVVVVRRVHSTHEEAAFVQSVAYSVEEHDRLKPTEVVETEAREHDVEAGLGRREVVEEIAHLDDRG